MRHPLFLTLLLCVLAAAPAVAGPVEAGRDLLAKGEVLKAVELLEKAVEEQKDDVDLRLALGDAYLAAQEADKAIDAGNSALELVDDKSAPGWLLRGRGFALKAEQYKAANAPGRDIRLCFLDAAKSADFALEIDPRIAGAHIIKAQAALGDFKSDEAEAELRKEIEVDPKGAEAPMLLGNLLFGKKDYDGAIEMYRKSLEGDAENALVWKWLGAAYEWKKDEAAAALAFTEALRREPGDGYALTRLMATAGAETIATLRKLLDEMGGPGKKEAAVLGRKLAWVLGQYRKPDEALALLAKLIQTNPKDANNHVYRANVLLQKGERDAAAESLRKAVLLDPNVEYPYRELHKLAIELLKQRRTSDGLEVLEWLFGARKDADVANDIALTHRDHTRNYKKSLEWYLVACDLAPRNVNILNDTAVIYQYHLGQPGKAEELYRKVLEIGRADHRDALRAGKDVPLGYRDMLENLSMILMDKGKHEEALELLDELLGYEPGREKALELRRKVRDELGR